MICVNACHSHPVCMKPPTKKEKSQMRSTDYVNEINKIKSHASEIFLVRKRPRHLTNVSISFRKDLNDVTNSAQIFSKVCNQVNIMKDFNMNLNIFHQTYPNPDFFTYIIYNNCT